MMFDGVLGKKKSFQTTKMSQRLHGEKCACSKRLTYDCGQKVEISSEQAFI